MRFKEFLPFTNYTLTSKLSVEEVKRRISENTEPERYFHSIFSSFDKPFEGEIKGDTFQIIRSTFQYSINPVITGNINNDLGQTFIKISIRPKMIMIVLMGIWILSMLPSSLNFLESLLQSGKSNFSGYSFQSFLTLIIFWSIILIMLKIKINASKKFLASLLEGEEVGDY